MSTYHVPVLYHQSIKALNIKPDGIYVDCTFGGGGHSKGILEALSDKGRLIAFDQDADAKQNIPQDERLIFIPENFMHITRFLKLNRINTVDGILADLGVSSFQFDQAERGFSTRFDGPLDMRMDRRQTKTARQVLEDFSEKQLHKMFEQYGEVTNSKTLAKYIVQNRQQTSLRSIEAFKTLLKPVVKGNPAKYFAQVFQAIRIEVNDEMGALMSLLKQCPMLLTSGGRIAIITFHSIEDKLVKHFFKNESFEEEADHPFLNTKKEKQLSIITKKPIVADEKELKENSRARSAKLRVAEKMN